MKFIYVLDEAVAKDLELAGFKKVEGNSTVTINGKKAIMFHNNRKGYINKYQKQSIILSNKLFF